MRALITSSTPAASRTVLVSEPSIVPPAHPSATWGPWLTLPRVGLRPTRPHSLAGILIDPPPSLACATGTMPAATAAADPPDEPPAEWPGFHGFLVAGKLIGSVVTVVPNSGTLVRPRTTNPAARNCSARYEVTGQRTSRSGPIPNASSSPATMAPMSLSRNGTPRNGPAGSSPLASSRAWSNLVLITASSCGLTFSILAIAASTSSAGLASSRLTSSACAVASSHVVSLTRRTYMGTGMRPRQNCARCSESGRLDRSDWRVSWLSQKTFDNLKQSGIWLSYSIVELHKVP